MPRIPVRTSPYHTLPRCTRHYKSKRDLILRALGKAAFINGSQFVIAWISPKGEVDSYASELLQSAVNNKDPNAPCVLNRKELDREASRIKVEMMKRWDEIRRLEEAGEAPSLEEDGGEEAVDMEAEDDTNDLDPDSTLVDESEFDMKFLVDPTPSAPVTLSIPSVAIAGPSSSTSTSIRKSSSSSAMMSAFPSTATRASTPGPTMHNISLAPEAVDPYYNARFAALQQATCKLVVKNWIKVIEPKKQMKFPYNKGEDLKPLWWPEGVRHREPDHLSKQERLTLLTSIVRSPLISVSRLELSTAEAGAFISGPRQSILREVYLVAKEEEKKRRENDSDPVINVYLPHLPVSPSAVTPEGGEKRPHAQIEVTGASNKENVFQTNPNSNQMLAVPPYGTTQPLKRMKTQAGRLPALNIPTFDPSVYSSPFSFAPQNLNIGNTSHQQQQPNAWRDGVSAPPPHLSPYPQQEVWGHSAPPTEYARSPMPELDMNQQQPSSSSGLHTQSHAHHQGQIQAHHQIHSQPSMQQQQTKYATHLAPILTTGSMNGTPSPGIDSPAFTGQSTATSTQSGYFPRSHTAHTGHSYMQQQQIDYLQQQHHQQQATYDYGSPYLADWDQTYTTA